MKISAKQTYLDLVIGISAVALIGVGLLGAGWYYVLGMSEKANEMTTASANLKREESKLSDLGFSYAKVLPQNNIITSTIPQTKDESTFMADLEQLAGKNNIVLTSATVGVSQTKTTKASEFSQTVSKSQYYELPIKYEVSGTYTDYYNFIRDLNTLRRLNSVKDLAVTADFSDKAVTNKIKGVLTITIFAKK